MRSIHPDHRAVSAARRRRRLILAVAAPGVLVIAAGLRLAAQERELERRRAADARRSSVADVRHALIARLEQARVRALSRLATDAAPPPADVVPPAVAVIARRNGQRFVPPWERDSAALAFAAERNAPPRLMTKPSPSGRAYNALLRAQRDTGTARVASFTRVAALPLNIRDEFGVPFALYGAAALRESAEASAVVRATVQRATEELLAWHTLSPAACHQLRALAQDGLTTIDRRCAELDKIDQLSRDATALLGRKSTGVSTWTYHPDMGWLVAVSTLGDVSALLAVRADEALRTLDVSAARTGRIVGAAQNAEPLGAELESAYLVLSPIAGPTTSWLSSSNILLIGTALIGIVTMGGGMLLVRDVRRESDTAALRAQFASSVSHELKTPLAAIRLYAETLRDRPTVSASQRDAYLDTIVTESERLTRLLDNVLDVARIDRGQKSYALRPLLIGDVVRQAVRTLEHPLAQQGFSLSVSTPRDVVTVLGDADALQQALINLLVNAMKYSGDSRDIGLGVTIADGAVHLAVSDAGLGIPEPEQRRIFEEFYRIPAHADTGVAGTGLGLTIVQHVAAAHGGRVDVRSAPGRGSTFTLSLPAHLQALPTQATA